jgi:hypothetical protein
MRTRCALNILLIVACVAEAGQHHHAGPPATGRDQMHTHGFARQLPPALTTEPDAQDAHFRSRKVPQVPAGRWKTERSDGMAGAQGYAMGRLPIDMNVAPEDPFFAHRSTLTAPDRSTRISGTTAVLAPFDTVYDTGVLGERIHIYSYVRGKLTSRLTMRRTDGIWTPDAGYLCTYTASGLLETATAFSNTPPWRDVRSYLYDLEGMLVAYRSQYYRDGIGTPYSASFDTMAHDAQGQLIYRRSENWCDGKQVNGSGWMVTWEDTAKVTTYEEWQRGEWVNTERWVEGGSVRNGRYGYCLQTSDGPAWINQGMGWTDYDDEGRSLRWSWHRWLNDAWVETERGSSSYDPSGSRRYYAEAWDESGWHPTSQYWDTTYAGGHTRRYVQVEWGDGSISTYAGIADYGTDGRRRAADSAWIDGMLRYVVTSETDPAGITHQTDSSWTGGRLSQVDEYRHNASGQSLLSAYRYWDETSGRWWGWLTSTTYTSEGFESEVAEHSWSEGSWLPEVRYVFTYDGLNRLQSLKFFEGRQGLWLAPREIRDQGGSSGGGQWTLNWDDYRASYFGPFDELVFRYRADVSEVSATTDGGPARTQLHQNYPNPFNPATTIPFSVATGARTTVTIFDVLGREVARPIDEWKDPGEYKVQFDASGLASGMYICRFTAGSVTQARQLMLVR